LKEHEFIIQKFPPSLRQNVYHMTSTALPNEPQFLHKR